MVWSLIALLGLSRGLMLLREAILDRRSLGTAGNGRRMLANGEVEHAWMGVLIYFCLLAPGLIALAYRLDILPLELRLYLTPFFLVGALFALAIRQERDAYYRRRYLGLAPPYARLRVWLQKAFRWLCRRLKRS